MINKLHSRRKRLGGRANSSGFRQTGREGEPGAQWTMFFRDRAGHPIKLIGFANEKAVCAAW
ncbi:hypothetical protein U0C82_07330 [Fulvimarina sp. 2208YS6-2-32]|uniref:AP2 domain-containing protein n=1 Tax=Fulvimarina uroteuthidis TaxID=3098149 RepID=A0ABU5I163_9HYPH|nr:hypothetical protein [Fulvimarina sp. 2208YS6-2-32]